MWQLPFLAVFLPIVLLSVYAFQVASDSARASVQEENITTAESLAQFITQDIRQQVKLAHAVASIPGTVRAVEERDELAIRTRLKAIMVSSPQIHRAFITDADGVLWSEFPTAEGAYGSYFTDWNWFRSVKAKRKPNISGLYIRPQFPDEPVVALAVPILGGEQFLGVLVFEYRVRPLSQWLENIRLGISGHMLLLDQNGSLLAHPTIPVGGVLNTAYRNLPEIRKALGGSLFTGVYVDPSLGTEMVASFMPIAVGENMWVAVAEQPTSEAFALLHQVKTNLGAAGLILTLFTLVTVIALARTSAKVVRLNAELQAINQAMKDFTSIVSHQLKAPITAMRWNLEMILDGDFGQLNEKLRGIVQQLHEVNVSNYHLVMDILNVSRLDRGVVKVDLAPIPLTEVVERAVRDYRLAAEHAGIYLHVEAPKQPIIVMMDLEKTAESITNSLSNAIKYTKKGGITVTLSVQDGMGVIDVTDTGPGMPEDMMKHLFSRDGVKGSNASAEGSSGLGLYIAKNFMQMQGGDVTVTSEVGKGTTFTYTLPLVTTQDAKD